tara:strand:- start:420 stop:566 length:147 start_codon:yes stop_codon:yes gene_type:complete
MGMRTCVTDDFEWRQAVGPDASWGRVVQGKPADWRGCDLYEVRDGKIA